MSIPHLNIVIPQPHIVIPAQSLPSWRRGRESKACGERERDRLITRLSSRFRGNDREMST